MKSVLSNCSRQGISILFSVFFCLVWGKEEALGNRLSQFRVFYNTDYLSAGVGGLRNYGYGTINLTNLTGAVTQAYLYWHGPMSGGETNPAANAAVVVNQTAVIGENIGLGPDNCWASQAYAYSASRAYRADVTTLVASNRNGAYQLSNFMKPLGTNAAGINVNGASLVVFYDDGNPDNNKDIILSDGNDANSPSAFSPGSPDYDEMGWFVKMTNFVYRTGPVSIELHVSDGQYFEPLDDGAVTLNNNIVLAPQGHIFSGDRSYMPSANNGPTGNGCLWDIKSWRLETYLTNGQSTLTVSNRYALAD